MSDFASFDGEAWRLVEAQYRVSTMKLVEEIIETVKPPLPAECGHLHYLLSTPFRYGAPYPRGSRIRSAGYTAGVWYGARKVETAVAEMAFYRLLFFAESPDTPWPGGVSEFTAFAAMLATERMVDLLDGTFDLRRPALEHPTNYEACHALADEARGDGAEIIRYLSVRDPRGGSNLAVLACAAFARPAPFAHQGWSLRISANGVLALGPGPGDRLGFDCAAFAADPRIAAMIWDRQAR